MSVVAPITTTVFFRGRFISSPKARAAAATAAACAENICPTSEYPLLLQWIRKMLEIALLRSAAALVCSTQGISNFTAVGSSGLLCAVLGKLELVLW